MRHMSIALLIVFVPACSEAPRGVRPGTEPGVPDGSPQTRALPASVLAPMSTARAILIYHGHSTPLPDLEGIGVRVLYEGGACCPGHSIPSDSMKAFTRTVLDGVSAVMPGAPFITSVDPPGGLHLEIIFRMADECTGVDGHSPWRFDHSVRLHVDYC